MARILLSGKWDDARASGSNFDFLRETPIITYEYNSGSRNF